MNHSNPQPAVGNEQNVASAKAALARWSASTLTGEDHDAHLAKIQKKFRFYNSNIYVLNKVPRFLPHCNFTRLLFRYSMHSKSNTPSSKDVLIQKNMLKQSKQQRKLSLQTNHQE